MTKDRAPSHDDRWGDHVPWSLRYQVIFEKGVWRKFLSLLSYRLSSLIEHREAGIQDYDHFLERLSAESLGRFVAKNNTYTPCLRLRLFFSPDEINKEMHECREKDRLRPILDRLEVLESFLILLPHHQRHNALPSLVRDIKRFAAGYEYLVERPRKPSNTSAARRTASSERSTGQAIASSRREVS